MATEAFEDGLRHLNEDQTKLSSMLQETQVCYYNFTSFEEEEKEEKKTYTEESESF